MAGSGTLAGARSFRALALACGNRNDAEAGRVSKLDSMPEAWEGVRSEKSPGGFGVASFNISCDRPTAMVPPDVLVRSE